ncbi:MAG TPA: RNA-binding S4 domain-containing protein [Bacteroidales bacterium]|nr:RNA-binding S4 domain-containing protein [Bacteroidales bacterium]HOS73534.1 RNA-binding S4 domain-containing protein [Bacteroidales bacterium]HQH22848.1 RNA-binding S4 domain-containing protein [Bacteroidales bacterium]HQJ81686.1 RNA-binding S4 domain-containing protein [Bacteroidales bacterium]
MTESKSVRTDKFLWAVRLFKTRTQAANACRMGRVLIDNNKVKPSKYLEGNEIIVLRRPPVTFTYRITGLTENRVGAKLVDNYLEDLTPAGEKIKLEMKRMEMPDGRRKGSGRPTKKERRVIDRWKEFFFL